MSESSFSRSYGLPTSPELYGFGLTGLLRLRVDAKNKRDLAMSEGVGLGGGKLMTSSLGGSSGGISGAEGHFNPTPSLGDVDKFADQLSKDWEALRKREDMKATPLEGPTIGEARANAFQGAGMKKIIDRAHEDEKK